MLTLHALRRALPRGRVTTAALALALTLPAWAEPPASAPPPTRPPEVTGWAWLDRDAADPRVLGLSLHVAQSEYEGIAAMAHEGDDDGERHVVKQGDARLPGRLRPGGLVTVISTRGLSEAVLESFDVYSEEGNSYLTAKARATGAKAVTGLAVAGTVAPKARLRAPRGAALPKKDAARLLAAVAATGAADAQDAVGRPLPPLTAKDLRALDVRAPAGGRVILAKQRLSAGAGGAPDEWVVGLFLAAADGALTPLVSSGLHPSAGFSVPWCTDIDGDGVDELVVETEWAEGSTSRDVLVWHGDRYLTVGL